MHLLFISEYISNQVIQAICRTLLHSLWQGLFAAVLAGLIILVTKKSKAAVRYNLLSLLFAAFFITNFITFLLQPGIISTSTNGQPVTKNILTNITTTSTIVNENLWYSNTAIINLYNNILRYSDRYAGLLTGIWLLFFSIHVLRMGTGLHYAWRIRHQQTISAGEEWKKLLSDLSKTLKLKKPVSLMESAIVKVPVVTGMLKPVILIPLGMLTNLSAKQIETILLHELAHVKRRDFLVNLLQRFVESIFFFNPFILWISSRIREEREACCDDIVLDHTTDKRSYLEALVSFREAAFPAYSPAMTLGNSNKLLYRVKRMITQENKKLNAMEKLTLILILTAGTAFTFMPTGYLGKSNQHDLVNKQQSRLASYPEKLTNGTRETLKELKKEMAPKDTVPETITFPNINSILNDDDGKTNTVVTAKDSNGKTYHYQLKNDILVELSIDGKKISKDDFHKYRPVVDQIEIIRKKENEKAIHFQEMDVARLHKEQAELNNKLLQLQAGNNADVMKKMAADAQEQFKLQSENNTLLLNKIDLANDAYNKLEAENKLQLLAQHDQAAVLNNKILLLQHQQTDLGQLLPKQNEALLRLQEGKMKLLAAQDEQFHDSNFQLSRIIEDLAAAGLFEDKNHLSFTLDNNVLIVDGKKQPSDIHEKFRKKYIRSKKEHFIYKAGPNSRSTDVYVE